MLRKGIQARCERCGENKFYADEGVISVTTRIETDGWEERLGKTLCLDCAAAFDKLTEQFFNEVWGK